MTLKQARDLRECSSSSPLPGIILPTLLMACRTEAAAHPTAIHAPASLALVLVAALLFALGYDPRGTLTRDGEPRRNSREVADALVRSISRTKRRTPDPDNTQAVPEIVFLNRARFDVGSLEHL